MTATHNRVKTELCPYVDAPWAHHLPGGKFDWAWRVSRPSGDSITGALKGKKADAIRRVKDVAKRMQKIAVGTGSYGVFRIKNEG